MKVESIFQDLKLLMELTYKMIKGKELGVSVDEVEIQTRSVEIQEEAPSHELKIDPTNVAFTSGVGEDLERINLALWDLNVLVDPIVEDEGAREEEAREAAGVELENIAE